MSFNLKIILILFGLAYLISPIDIIPDLLLPFAGWIDDGVIIGTIYYLIRYKKFPDFFFKNQNPYKQQFRKNNANFASNKNQQSKNKSSKKHKTAHEILGVSSDASKKEIQSAYKKAAKKYHPDKLSHLGKEFSSLANEKFLEIQKAYDTLMKKYQHY